MTEPRELLRGMGDVNAVDTGACQATLIRLLVAAAYTVALVTELDKWLSDDELYPVVRPLIVSSLLWAAWSCVSVEEK